MNAPATAGPLTGRLFFCHGARDDRWREPFEAIVTEYQQARPDEPVRLAFLELMEPDFDSAVLALVDQGAEAVQVVPLFLAPGRHTRVDLPALINRAREKWPGVQFSVQPSLTENPAVRQAIVASALADEFPDN